MKKVPKAFFLIEKALKTFFTNLKAYCDEKASKELLKLLFNLKSFLSIFNRKNLKAFCIK